jgi:beta-lactamase regulating signal transducer with metallopeptidase domain
MIYSIIHNIPTAILNSILLLSIFWVLFQFAIYTLKWSATKRYQIATSGLLIAAVFFLLELVSIKTISIFQSFHFSLFFDTAYLLGTPSNTFLIVAAVYFVLLVFFLIKFIVQFKKLTALKDNSDFSNSNNYKLIIQENICSNSESIKIGINNTITSPLVFGILETIILLPASLCTQLTSTQLKCILLHELAHIERNDFIINLLIEIAGIFLWFNPIAILLKKEIQLQREVACDEFVLSKMKDPLCYSKTLLKIASHSISSKYSISLAAIAGKNELTARIQIMNGLKSHSKDKLSILLIGCLLPLFFLFTKIDITKPIPLNSKKGIRNFASTSVTKNERKHIVSNTKLEKLALVSNKKIKRNKSYTNSSNKIYNNAADLSYNDLVKQTKDWIMARENNINYANYIKFDNSEVSKEIADEEMVNKIILFSIIKNYQLKKALLNQKVKNAADSNEARDFILNSDEWNEMVQYEKWVQAMLNCQ